MTKKYKFETLSDAEFEEEMRTFPGPEELGMMYRYQAIIWCIDVSKKLKPWKLKSKKRLRRITLRAINGS